MPENTGGPGVFGRPIPRRTILTGAAAGVLAPVLVTGAQAHAEVRPGAGTGSVVVRATGDGSKATTRHVTLYAESMAGGLTGYGLEPGKATVPGPIIEMWEGDTYEVTLVNTTDQRLSIHPHGVDYDVASDGTPMNDSATEAGQTRTYVWKTHRAHKRKDGTWAAGSAGYWHYHDHAMGGDHGTLGISQGLYGALIVRRRNDVLPDKQFTVVFNDMTINNKVGADVPVLQARLGERVEFVAIGHGNNFHTFHVHAHRWADNRTGLLDGPHDTTPLIDNKDLNPGSSFGFQVIAGEGVGPGAWMYHCHVQYHADGGMVGVFLVTNEDGSVPQDAQAALARFHSGHMGHMGHR